MRQRCCGDRIGNRAASVTRENIARRDAAFYPNLPVKLTSQVSPDAASTWRPSDAGLHSRNDSRGNLKILVSGSSGLLGSALAPILAADGHRVVRLVRRPSVANEISWDPEAGDLDTSALGGVDAVIHLAGEPIVGRWTAAKKRRVLESRVRGTQLLASAVAGLAQPPRVLVAASAVGYYGDRGGEVLTEASPPGEGFLAEVTQAWEGAADPARRRGIRVVHLRTGLVLAKAGGVLGKMLTPFRLALGGRLGSGTQYWSWIAIDDVVAIVRYTLETSGLSGPINVTAPTPVTNREFSASLARVLRRPAVVPVPRAVLRLVFGAAADGAVLVGCRALPSKLLALGYRFQFPDLEPALRHIVGGSS